MTDKNQSGISPKHIVVVGGGFGGVATARALMKKKNVEVTLVSDTTTFRYYPALYRLAVGFNKQQGLIPLISLLSKRPNVRFLHAGIRDLDLKNRTIKLSTGEDLHYDYAVLALGVTTSYFNIEGLEKYSYSIKTPNKLRAFHTHLHNELTQNHHLDKNYIVVGGGPTGVELSASLAGYLKETAKRHKIKQPKVKLELIEAAPRLLPTFNPKASQIAQKRLEKLGVKVMTGAKVEEETSQTLHVNGRSLPSHTVVWTAGVANNEFYKHHANLFQFSKRGRVIVDEHLQVDPHVYVIGDNSETPFSGLAEVAIMHGRYVTKDIEHKINHQRRYSYHNKRPTYVVPVGNKWALIQANKFVMGGYIGGLVRLAADFIGYSDVMGPKRAISILRKSEVHEETCKICRASLAHGKALTPSATENRD